MATALSSSQLVALAQLRWKHSTITTAQYLEVWSGMLEWLGFQYDSGRGGELGGFGRVVLAKERGGGLRPVFVLSRGALAAHGLSLAVPGAVATRRAHVAKLKPEVVAQAIGVEVSVCAQALKQLLFCLLEQLASRSVAVSLGVGVVSSREKDVSMEFERAPAGGTEMPAMVPLSPTATDDELETQSRWSFDAESELQSPSVVGDWETMSVSGSQLDGGATPAAAAARADDGLAEAAKAEEGAAGAAEGAGAADAAGSGEAPTSSEPGAATAATTATTAKAVASRAYEKQIKTATTGDAMMERAVRAVAEKVSGVNVVQTTGPFGDDVPNPVLRTRTKKKREVGWLEKFGPRTAAFKHLQVGLEDHEQALGQQAQAMLRQTQVIEELAQTRELKLSDNRQMKKEAQQAVADDLWRQIELKKKREQREALEQMIISAPSTLSTGPAEPAYNSIQIERKARQQEAFRSTLDQQLLEKSNAQLAASNAERARAQAAKVDASDDLDVELKAKAQQRKEAERALSAVWRKQQKLKSMRDSMR